MEKKNLFFIGMIILIGMFSVYFIVNYNLENNQEYVQSYCGSWAEQNDIVHVACVGNWTLEEKRGVEVCNWECEEPVGPGPFSCNEPYELWDYELEECVEVEYNFSCGEADDVQECCNEWARDNGIAHIMCTGSWVVEEDGCGWVCD